MDEIAFKISIFRLEKKKIFAKFIKAKDILFVVFNIITLAKIYYEKFKIWKFEFRFNPDAF